MKNKTGSVKFNKTAKFTIVKPVRELAGPLHQPVPVKRGPGRPRKVDVFNADVGAGSSTFADAKKLQMGKDATPQALVVFRRAMADAEKLLMTPAGFDGGGTIENAPTVTKESLRRRVDRRLNVLDRFLTDDKLVELLTFSNLKEVGIFEGIMLDKSLVLQGQPTVIIGNTDRATIDGVMPRLLSELKRRKLITSVSERKVEFKDA